MKIFGREITFSFKMSGNKPESVSGVMQSQGIEAMGGRYGASYVHTFDGEKTVGEIGPVVRMELDFHALRNRSWEAFLTSEIAKTVLSRYFVWIIDKGLKLQCSPAKDVLQSEGINLDSEKFNSITEARFSVWAGSKMSSYSGMQTLHDQSKDGYKNGKVGGDVLVILRVVDGRLTVELIDAAHVVSPFDKTIGDDNKVIYGVEIDKKGQHVAYHVRKRNGGTDRIEARSKSTGLISAYLVYGSKYRMNEVRGLPIISTSLETISKIGRYKEAAVGSAEERQKIVYTIEHDSISDGSSPLRDNLAQMVNANGQPSTPVDQSNQALAETVAATTNKETYNLTPGSKLVALESKNEMFFKEFYETNANIICAAVGIPPNVAFSLYNDSFSASRAATKDWEHTMDVERDDFKSQFYDPIFALWLHLEILNSKITAPGYLAAFRDRNFMVTQAYLNNRFTGPMFPHIDPLKEAKAEREKLGPLGANIPLTTVERATEVLNGSDYDSNVEQFSKEINKAEGLGLIINEKVPDPVED